MSDNFKGVLKQANNDVTGDAIRSGKGGNEEYAKGHETVFGKQEVKQRYIGMNYKEACQPTLTQCPRCNNPHNGCDTDWSKGFTKLADITDTERFVHTMKNEASDEAKAFYDSLGDEPPVMGAGSYTPASGLMAKIKEAQRLRPHTFAITSGKEPPSETSAPAACSK